VRQVGYLLELEVEIMSGNHDGVSLLLSLFHYARSVTVIRRSKSSWP